MLPDSKGGLAASRPEWSYVDFILIWLGGFLGTGAFLAVGLLVEGEDAAIALAIAGQYAGNLGVWWLLRRQKQNPSVGFIIERGDFFYVGVGLGLSLLLSIAVFPLSELLFPDGAPSQRTGEILANADSTFLTVSLVIGAVLLAPAIEELLFRGVLIRAMADRSRRFIMLVTAALFAAVHVIEFVGQDQFLRTAAVFLTPLFILGLLLAWVTLRSGRLGPAIFIHSGWNLLVALVLIIPPELMEQASG